MSLTASTGLMRALGAVLMVAASLALGACGDDDSDRPGTKSGLGADRYEALDAVFAAALPLDALDDDAPTRDVTKALERYEKPCNALARDDALLGSYRRYCPLVAELRKQLTASDACEDETGLQECLDSVSGARRVMRESLTRAAEFDRAVVREQLEAACRAALRNPKRAYDAMRSYGRGFAYLERALKTGSQEDAATGERLLKGADAISEELPSAKQAQRDFRAGCD